MFTPGERGCAAAHLCVLEDMVQEKIPILIVYEDDVRPCDGDHYSRVLDDHVLPALAASTFDVVFMGHMEKEGVDDEASILVPRWSYCMHAYALTIDAARRILDDASRHGWNEPIDITLNHHSHRTRLQSGLVNRQAVARAYGSPVTFNGAPAPNKRSYGVVCQRNELLTSIKTRELQPWRRW